jgi:hypothetical protein
VRRDRTRGCPAAIAVEVLYVRHVVSLDQNRVRVDGCSVEVPDPAVSASCLDGRAVPEDVIVIVAVEVARDRVVLAIYREFVALEVNEVLIPQR